MDGWMIVHYAILCIGAQWFFHFLTARAAAVALSPCCLSQYTHLDLEYELTLLQEMALKHPEDYSLLKVNGQGKSGKCVF